MSIRIEKLKKPDLGVVKMNCDGVINKNSVTENLLGI